MNRIKKRRAVDDFLSVKETAYTLHISPKTIYNKLSKKEFPLAPFRLPWNRRDLFFHRSEVMAMALMRTDPTRSCLRKLLRFIPQPSDPVSVAVLGPPSPILQTIRNPLLLFKQLAAERLSGWREEHDLLWVNKHHPAICLAGSSPEHYEAAAVLGGLVSESLRGERR